MSAETRVCPSCGYENRADSRFCSGCGTPFTSICSSCGKENQPDARFCDQCGTPLNRITPAPANAASDGAVHAPKTAGPAPAPATRDKETVFAPPQEERRLVTALFCDLVGFTPLAEELDPEEVRDMQASYFEAMTSQIERYGGVVEKYAGDAILALFGAPVAHEDDAERAVLCALGMQSAIAPAEGQTKTRWEVEPAIRVGVNTGEVVSGAWNASGRQDVAVTGDAVNTAARIQSVAEPGEVLTGIETMRLTRRRIRFGERRDVVLKGKIGTVPVYPAIGLRERFGERWETSEGATPLIGRDREMVALLDAWVRAQGGEGQHVTLIGDAGVGKSRLIAEVIDKIAANSAVRIVRARCLSYGQEIALWLIADLLRSLFDIGEGDALAETQMKLNAVLPGLLVASDPQTQAEALDVLGEVLGLPPGNSLVAQAEAPIRRQALIRSLKLLIRSLSERAPTVLVLEDMHWLDASSQEVLKEILSDVPGLRLLALVAQRPGWTAPWSDWGWTERITLRPLGETEAALLAGAVLGGLPLSAELQAYLAERAGGNPFFVEELLRALEETNGLVEREGAIMLAPGAAERLPSTLTEVLLARLDRLESQVRNVVQVASVIGRSFAVRLLAQVMERENTALELPLAALQQAEIAFPKRGGDLEYVFKHVTMREVAYNTLVQKRRQELHRQTARAIATLYPSEEYVEIIAYHYARTQEHAEAAEWLERAGDRARSIYANETAIANYQEARKRREAVAGELVVLARLDEKLGETYFATSHFDEAIQVLERSVEIYRESRDLEGAGRSSATLGRALNERREGQEGLNRVEPMIEMLTWSGPSPALASLHLALGSILHMQGRYEEMLASAERAEEISGAIKDQRRLAWAMERRASALAFLGRGDEAIPILEEAVPLLERVGELERLIVALMNLGEAHRATGDLEKALQYNRQGVEIAERIGNLANVGFGVANIAEILLSMGAWMEALEHLERAQEVLVGLSATSADQYVPLIRGQILLAMGNWDDAEAALVEGLAIAEASGERQALEVANKSMAELELLRSEPEAAIRRLEPLAGREGGFRVLIETVLAWALLEAGEVERAASLVTAIVELGRTQGERLALTDALRVQGMVLAKEGRQDEAVAAFEEALEMARPQPYPLAEARILYQRGLLAEQRGESEPAQHYLEESLAIAQRLGAQNDIELAEQALSQQAGLTQRT